MLITKAPRSTWARRRAYTSSKTRDTIKTHDLGGDQALLDTLPPKDAPLKPWELDTHALFATLAKKNFFSTDEARRAIEAMPEESYAAFSYYEKFAAAAANLMRENGHIEPGELECEVFGSLGEAAADVRFAAGDRVRVRAEETVRTSWRRPHCRTPGYLFGSSGVVDAYVGDFRDPSLLAYGIREAPLLPLYRVRFCLADIWSEVEPEQASDTLVVDVYGNWLEKCGRAPSSAGAKATVGVGDDGDGHAHHGGGDSHNHDSHGHHDHGTRAQIERAAFEAEGMPRPGSALVEALTAVLVRKGLVTRQELRKQAQALESAAQELIGARLVVAAWTDDAFRARLLDDANSAARELGVEASNPNAPTQLLAVENTASVHNLVVCTLCSCYPAALLGPAPLWYKSSAFRARAVRRPRALLRDGFGLSLPADVSLRVHDSTADLRFLVIPRRPAFTHGWSDEQLRALVTRDSMVGTEVLDNPET